MSLSLSETISQSTPITLGIMLIVVSFVFSSGMFTMRVLQHETYMEGLKEMVERSDIRIEQNRRRIEVLERHVEWLEREQQQRQE